MTTGHSPPLSWSARLLIALVLLLIGAAAMTWAMSNYPGLRRVLGIAPATPVRMIAQEGADRGQSLVPSPQPPAAVPADATRLAAIEQRLGQIENATQSAVGSAGRADALVVAFAARRAVDRGVPLGYLEPLLVQRFASRQQAAVATIVTAAQRPVTLDSLIAEYRALAPRLRSQSPSESWWTGLKRELGSLVEVRRASRPSGAPEARYDRALQRLEDGKVETALAETMRMPGAEQARPWVERARRYVAAQRALDQIESAALLGDGKAAPERVASGVAS